MSENHRQGPPYAGLDPTLNRMLTFKTGRVRAGAEPPLCGLLALLLATILSFNPSVHAHAGDFAPDTTQTGGTLIPIPIIFYTPETRLGGGVSAMYYFRTSPGAARARPSLLAPTFIITQRRQIIAELLSDVYLRNDDYRVHGSLSFVRFPETFFGIGPDASEAMSERYTPQRFGIDVSIQRRLTPNFRLGAQYLGLYHRIVRIEEDGMLDSGLIPGYQGGLSSGIGLNAGWDSRDNTMSAHRGLFYQTSMMVFTPGLGSAYEFSRFRLDLRQYVPLRTGHILASQIYSQLSKGNVPFYHMAPLGGSTIMRGYLSGRFRDRQLIAAQVEYRFPLWWRFGGVGFAGAGDVADSLGDFELGRFKYSYGGGLRFMLDDRDRMNLRFDYGFGNGVRGFYFSIGEAF